MQKGKKYCKEGGWVILKLQVHEVHVKLYLFFNFEHFTNCFNVLNYLLNISE